MSTIDITVSRKPFFDELDPNSVVQAIPFDGATPDKKCVALAHDIFQKRGWQIESAAINSNACFLLARKKDEHYLVRILHSDVHQSQSTLVLKGSTEPLTCLHVWEDETFYWCSNKAVFKFCISDWDNPSQTDSVRKVKSFASISRMTLIQEDDILILPQTSIWTNTNTRLYRYQFAEKTTKFIDIALPNAVDIAVLPDGTICSLHHKRRSIGQVLCSSLFCVPLCFGDISVIKGTIVAISKFENERWKIATSERVNAVFTRFTSSTNLITFRGEHAYGGLTRNNECWLPYTFRRREPDEMFSDMVRSYTHPRNYFSGEYHGKSLVAYDNVVKVDDVQIPADFKLDREFRLLADDDIPFVYLVNDKSVSICFAIKRPEKAKD